MYRRTRAALATGLVLTALTWMTLHGLLFYRPLPTIDGYYRFVGLDQRAEVVRDAFGVPRIEAGTLHDLFFLQGYVTAQDRFAQMEAMRAEAEPYQDAADIALASANEDLRVVLDAYADGVTKYITQHSAARALPAGVALTNRRPEPWTAADPLAIEAAFLESSRDSTCLVIPGERALRRRPMLTAELASDALPPGWYEIGLSGSGTRAIGVSLPGVPGITTGHNGLVAWSLYGSGMSLDPRRALTVLLGSMRARTIAELRTPTSGVLDGPLGGCLADIGGSAVALRPRVFSTEGDPPRIVGDELALLAAFRLGAARDIDVEALRSLLIDALLLLHPPLPPSMGGPPGPPAPAPAGARIILDLGDLDSSKAALSTGQSGHLAAFHYGDQAQLWSAGQLHRLAWTSDAVARTEGRLVLRPR